MRAIQELRWLLASKLFNWVIALTEREQTPEMKRAVALLAVEFNNDPKYNTIPMRASRRDK